MTRETCKKCNKVMLNLYYHTSEMVKGKKRTVNVKTDIFLCRWCGVTRRVNQ